MCSHVYTWYIIKYLYCHTAENMSSQVISCRIEQTWIENFIWCIYIIVDHSLLEWRVFEPYSKNINLSAPQCLFHILWGPFPDKMWSNFNWEIYEFCKWKNVFNHVIITHLVMDGENFSWAVHSHPTFFP